MNEFRERLVDALNHDWDGGAFGSICPEDIVDVEVRFGVVTVELSEERGGYEKYRTLPTDWVLTLLLKSTLL